MRQRVFALAVAVVASSIGRIASAEEQAGVDYSRLKYNGPLIGTWRYEGPALGNVPGMAEKGSNCLIQI